MWLYSEIRTLGDIPRHFARTAPLSTALRNSAGSMTFAELDARSNRVANGLRALGIGSGDRVAFLSKNCLQYFELLFGCCKIGAVLLPLNWRLARPEMAAIIEDASPSLFIADREYEAVAQALPMPTERNGTVVVFDCTQPGIPALDAAGAIEGERDPGGTVDPWQTAILMYTSGTTGKAKGVQLSHQGYLYLRLCEHLEPSFSYTSSDSMITVMPLFHAMGIGLSLQALYNGAAVSVYPMPDPGELIRLIERDRPTLLPLIPTVIQMMLDHPSAATADFSSVRVVVYAGSPIGLHLLTRALAALKCDFIQFYGATETGAGVTFLRPDQHRLGDEAVLKSCGSPLPLIEIKIADPLGNEVADGEVGELLIRSPSLTTGYFNQPELTAAAFRDGWYRSGDGGYKDASGLLYLVDRIKDMIISGGENVYSTEVEQAVQSLSGVRMCAVVGLPDDKWGERIVVAIVRDPALPLTTEQVTAHCRERIAGYKVPKQVVFLPSLPMTASGKVMKQVLREQLREA